MGGSSRRIYLNSPNLTENYLELIENRLSSSGIFPRTYVIGNPPENPGFGDRIIFMSMFIDIDWTKRGNSGQCISNSEQVKNYAKRFSQGHWTFLGPGDEMNLYGTHSYTLAGKWDYCHTNG